MRKASFLLALASSMIAIGLSAWLIPGVIIEGEINQIAKTVFLAGLVLGVINFFIKPIINVVTWPLRVLTFGLFGLAVNIGLVWIVDVLFFSLSINGLKALFLTSLVVWVCSLLIKKN